MTWDFVKLKPPKFFNNQDSNQTVIYLKENEVKFNYLNIQFFCNDVL